MRQSIQLLPPRNQSVVINGSGIHVGGDSKYQLRIVDSMIAMTDDNWATAKLAIGLFASDEVGTYFGVNAEVIGGKLIVGNNLVIENETDDGVPAVQGGLKRRMVEQLHICSPKGQRRQDSH